MEVNETAMSLKDMRILMDQLEAFIADQNHENLINCLIKAADYKPNDTIVKNASGFLTKGKNLNGKIINLPTKTISG